MSAWLRLLGVVVMALGIGLGAWAETRALGDVGFAEIEAQYLRHADNLAFQAEYYPAALRHWGLLAGGVVGILGGLVFGSLLLGMATLVARRPDDRRPPETQKAG